MNARQLSTTPGLRIAAAALALLLLAPAAAPAAAEAPAALAALVESMPDCDRDGKYTGPAPDVALKAVHEILKGGKDNIAALVGMLREPGTGDDYKAHYLLHAVGTHVRRPGAEEERQLVCEALGSTLDGEAPSLAKAHVLEELKWIGGKESVPAISKMLLDPKLYDFAAEALVAIRAAKPMRAALPKATGRNRVALTQALGVLRDLDAVPALIEALGQDDPAVRLAAAEALASIGDPRAVDPLLRLATLRKATYEEMRMAEAALRLAQALLDAGKKDDAKRIYTALAKQCPGKAGRHIRTGCLRGLVAVAGDEVLPELLAALADPDVQVRVVAARVAAALPGGNAVDKWLRLLPTARREDRAGILFVLGSIGDAAALPAMLKAMDDKDQGIRLEAIRSAAAIGGAGAAEALVARALAKEGDECDTALDSLARCRGQETNKVVAAAVDQATDPALKARLIHVLSARRASDQMAVILAAAEHAQPTVRIAAVRALEAIGGQREAEVLVKMLRRTKDADERKTIEQALLAIGPRARDQVAKTVIAALEGASPEAAAAMFRILGRVGGAEAAKALTTYGSSPDPQYRDEAIRRLSAWSESRGLREAADGLLAIAKAADDPKRQVMALRSYINLARSRHWRRNIAQQLEIYSQALQIATRPEEKRAVLGGLGGIQNIGALKIAATCLGDKTVAEEAAAAVVRIVGRLKNKTHEDIQAALAKVVDVSKNKRTVKEAQRFLIKRLVPEPL